MPDTKVEPKQPELQKTVSMSTREERLRFSKLLSSINENEVPKEEPQVEPSKPESQTIPSVTLASTEPIIDQPVPQQLANEQPSDQPPPAVSDQPPTTLADPFNIPPEDHFSPSKPDVPDTSIENLLQNVPRTYIDLSPPATDLHPEELKK